MKKLFVLWTIIIVQLICLTGCGNSVTLKDKHFEDGVAYVIEIVEDVGEGITLYDYILSKEEHKDAIEFDGITVYRINGVENSWNLRKYWVFYNDDINCQGGQLGQVKYKGKVLKSSSVGVDKIIVKKGTTYIWYYRKY
jgi:hypothetical protein